MVRASNRDAERLGGAAGDDHEGVDVAGHHGPGGDDGADPDRHLGLDDRAVADPAVGPEDRPAGGAGGEEIGIVLDVVPVVAGPVEEVMLRGVGEGVVGRADPRHRGDVGEAAHGRVRDVGEAVAVGVGLKSGIHDPGAFAHLGPGLEIGVHHLGGRMDHPALVRQTVTTVVRIGRVLLFQLVACGRSWFLNL